MQKIISVLFGCFVGISLYSQIGINTDNPQQLFHIDPLGNSTAAGNLADDIVVSATTGNVGIGTLSPARKLHISSTTAGVIRIADTQQDDGLILTSNNQGVGFWLMTKGSIVKGVPVVETVNLHPTDWRATSTYIDVPPQTNVVLCCLAQFSMNRVGTTTAEIAFSDSNTTFVNASTSGRTEKTIQYTGVLSAPPLTINFIVQQAYVEDIINATNATRRIYVWARGSHTDPTATVQYRPANTVNDLRIYGIVY